MGLMGKQDFGTVLLCECVGVRDDGRLIFRPVEWAPASLVVAGSMGIVSLLNHRLTSADLNLLNSHPMDSFLQKLFNWQASSVAYLRQNHRILGDYIVGVGAGHLPLVDFLFEAMAFSSLTAEGFQTGACGASPSEEGASPFAHGNVYPILRSSWGVAAGCVAF